MVRGWATKTKEDLRPAYEDVDSPFNAERLLLLPLYGEKLAPEKITVLGGASILGRMASPLLGKVSIRDISNTFSVCHDGAQLVSLR